MAGYSGKPLADKLGIKPGQRVKLKNAPADYLALLGRVPGDAQISARLRGAADMVHLFARSRAELARELRAALKVIPSDGVIWVSWPKKGAGVATDVTEDVVRELALPLSLVDVKVCAVDDTWSGLKLVIRKSARG